MTKEVQSWADAAMFRAEPLKASDGPKVFMLAGTPDPLGAVAAMAKMYKGEVVRNMDDITDEERNGYLKQIQLTKLKAPLEAVKVHFMVENVTRSFTHQMVRQRTAVYAQESLRFAVKEDMGDGVALPPSLAGTKGGWDPVEDGLPPKQEQMRTIWDDVVDTISEGYNRLVNMGMPAEDARGLLPHNITTRLNYVTDMRALQDHAGNRLCTQAQFEWRLVFVRIIEAMRAHCSNPYHSPEQGAGHKSLACDNWQWAELANIFRPVCYLTGKCEFKADFDRPCSIRARVEANHQIGRPSSEWDKTYGDPGLEGYTVEPLSKNSQPTFIGAIQPAEWLLDPAAAR